MFTRTADADSPGATPDTERFDKLCELVTRGLRNFAAVGRALEEIKDSQLYRCRFETFDECCRVQWHMTPQHAGRLIVAAALCRELEPTGSLPQTEHAARQIASLPKEERIPAWKEALTQGGDGKAVAAAVKKRRPAAKRSSRVATLRLRVPGGTVVIEPNKRFTDAETVLLHALDKLREKKLPRAA